MEPLLLTSFRGGLNDNDPESALDDDQLVVCQNVDLDQAPLGAKVKGSTHAGNGFPAVTDRVVFVHRHLPTSAQVSQRLVAIGTTGTTASGMWFDTAWRGLTFTDPLAVVSGQYHIQAKTIHGKMFLAYPPEGMIDRLHVWQSSEAAPYDATLRRAGIAPPGVPTVANHDTETAAFVQYAELLNTVSPAAKAFDNPVAAGSIIIVSAIWNSAATPTVTDSQGNTYTLRASQSIANFGAADRMGVWTSDATVAGACTVTITEGGGSFFNLLDIKEVSGINPDDPYDVSNSTSSSAASPATVATPVMSQEDGFVHALVASQLRDLTVGAGYTVRHDGSSTTPYWHLTEDKVVSAGGAQTATATFSGANEWGIIAVVLNTGGPGRIDTTPRYYRVRACRIVDGDVVRRSEPSESVAFTPSGVHGAVAITLPSSSADLTADGVNYFEIEASLDNANFYRINDTEGVHGEWVSGSGDVGSVWADYIPLLPGYGPSPALSQTVPVGYNANGVLSPDIGDYTVIHAPKFLAVDEDRLLYGGSWYQSDKASRVGWTPVFGVEGVGNDERLELDTDPFVDLDGGFGGEMTGMTDPVDGIIYVFKESAIYKVIRTGQRAKAYAAFQVTDKRGAIEGSIATGLDEAGNPCVYFADPRYGPCRVGRFGVEDCGGDVQTTWKTVNLTATVVARSIFDPNTKHLHLCLAVSGAGFPTRKLRLHTNLCRRTPQGVRRGWALDTNDSATALSWTLFPFPFTQTSLGLTPCYGRLRGGAVSAADQIRLVSSSANYADVGTGATTTYQGRAKSKLYVLGKLERKYGITKAAMLLTNEAGGSDYDLNIILTRLRHGATNETRTFSKTIDIRNAAGAPTLALLDDIRVSDLYAVQIELGDASGSPNESASWGLHLASFSLRDEGSIG